MFYEGFCHLVLSQQQLTFYFKAKLGKYCRVLKNYTFATRVGLLLKMLFQCQSNYIFVRINGILMIIQLMVSSKNVKVSPERCLRTSIESFTSASPSERITKG